MEDTSPEKVISPNRLSPNLLASTLDSPNAHTSFGKLPLANERSSPGYSFGKSTRKQQDRIFHAEELLVNYGKTSPGPKYAVKDNLSFKASPQFSIGNEPRKGFARMPHYDHYDVIDNYSDLISSADATKAHHGSIKFGTEAKFSKSKPSDTPGPQYLPPIKPELKNAPQYSIGVRRRSPTGSILEAQVSTTRMVGPGAYSPEATSFTSSLKNSAKWTMPQADRLGRSPEPFAKNETYDTRSTSCGMQIISKRKTSPRTKIGTSTRDQAARLGIFKDTMASVQSSVRIPHPNF